METINDPNIEELAKDFSKRLLEFNGIETMRKIVQLNKDEKDKCICHTHDFCDPNQFIIDTLENIGMKFPMADESEDSYYNKYFGIVDKVWGMASATEFYTNE